MQCRKYYNYITLQKNIDIIKIIYIILYHIEKGDTKDGSSWNAYGCIYRIN